MAVFTAIAAFAASSFIAGVIVNVGISVGLSLLAQALTGKPKGPKGPEEAQFGVKGQLQRGADLPQSFILGKYATAGTLTYANTTTAGAATPNSYMNWVITLSDLPINGVTGIWVNGVRRTLRHDGGPNYVVADYSRGAANFLVATIFDGTQTSSDPWLTGTVSTAQRPWHTSAVGHGRAYVVMRAHIDEDFWSNGFPNFLFEVEGIPLYNPAKDTSVGGSGSHRWANPATWESSENPAVQLYNILRGIRYDGEWFYGLQDVYEAQIPVAHWIGQINKCAATIQGADGPEPIYRSSAEIPVSAEIHTVIESLLAACNGRLSDAGGVYKLYAGAPESPVMGFTDADIISTSGQTFTPFLGLADTVNGVAASYPEPAAGWQVEAAPPLYRPDYEAVDGGRRLLVDVSLDFVPYAEQAQRLMQSALNEARRARRHTFTMPPEFWQLEPGDVISWTSERNGYVAKQFRVDGMMDAPNADVILDLTEVDQADYVWDTETDFTPPVIPEVQPQPIASQLILGFDVFPAILTDSDGVNRRPAIKAIWDGDVPDVRGVKFEIRVKQSGEMIDPAKSETVADGEIIISAGVLNDIEYEVRGKFIPNSPRPTEWTDWKSVITPDVRIAQKDIAQSVYDDLIEIAEGAGVPSFEMLPGEGDKPNQIVLKMPEAVLYRWDADDEEWVTKLYTDIQDDSVTSDSIIAGAIIASKIGAGEIVTQALAANAVTVSKMRIDNRLELDAKLAGFVMGKDSAYNVSDDGIYMGRTEEPGGVTGFGFAVSKTAPGGLLQSLSATYENGLRITNAKFYRDLETIPPPVYHTTNKTIGIDPSVTASITIAMIGGGSGGLTGKTQDGAQPGGATKVVLMDGSTVIKTWTAPGAPIGYGYSGNYADGGDGQYSVWGAGGIRGKYPNQAAGAATGFGAGGGGGFAARQIDDGASGGLAGTFLSGLTYSVAGLSNPKLVLTIGAGGAGGPTRPNVGSSGGRGSGGRVSVTMTNEIPFVADVIPLEPTHTGSLSSTGWFPDLGAGYWSISIGGNGFGHANIGVGSGNSIAVYAQRHTSFISSARPRVNDGALGAGANYRFHKMGP